MFWEGHKILQNLHLTFVHLVPVKYKVKISQNFVAFSEYMNFSTAIPSQHFSALSGSAPKKKLV